MICGCAREMSSSEKNRETSKHACKNGRRFTNLIPPLECVPWLIEYIIVGVDREIMRLRRNLDGSWILDFRMRSCCLPVTDVTEVYKMSDDVTSVVIVVFFPLFG